MKPLDQAYLEDCKRLIVEKFGIGPYKFWKQRDYEKLCELIYEKTNVSISLSTLKRILSQEMNNLPQKATLDALAQFIGYANWFDFTKKATPLNKTISQQAEIQRKTVDRSSAIKIAVYSSVFLSLFVSILLLFLRAYSPSQKEPKVIAIDTLTGKKFNDLALTPPMGWNSWNTFRLKIKDSLIREMADIMVEKGMKDAGYQYLIIDDGWIASVRDKQGNLVADTNKFPNGIKPVADYVHSKGLKIGLHSTAGSKNHFGKPGGRGHEFQDAQTFASWGIDYVKYDWGLAGNANVPETYKLMRDAIFAAGRPMVFSICELGNNKPWIWGKEVGHLWRTTTDITDCFDCKEKRTLGWKHILDQQVGLEKYAGPGHWNDPDMLEVGNPGLSLKESRAHFSMWCMLAAPLIAGNDLRKMSDDILNILTNKEAIAINQDSLGKQGYRFSNENGIEIWIKQLSMNNWALCILNTTKSTQILQVPWDNLPIHPQEYKVFDIWQNKTLGYTSSLKTFRIRTNDILFLKLIRKS